MHIDRPETIEEALKALSIDGAKALAGGTNVMVDIKKKRERAEYFVSLDALSELKKIEIKSDGLHIGSCATFTEIEEFLISNEHLQSLRVLKEAASLVGGPQIRNRGTIGGNILCASPSSDSVPALLVLDARLRLIKADRSERCLPLEGFITGVRRTALEPGELLYEIIIPLKEGISCFYKAGARKAMAISIVNQAMYLETEADGKISKAAIACGSVAPVVVRAPKTEAYLIGKCKEELLDDKNLAEAKTLLTEEISPITDLRAEKEYRLMVSENILEDNLKTLLGGC